ncbi:MAG: hypothetical protein ACREUF_02085 [Solimonas sp.]
MTYRPRLGTQGLEIQMETTMSKMLMQREILLASSYAPGAYPGSRAYMASMKVAAELKAFDEAHPEVKVAWDERKAALRAAKGPTSPWTL